MILKASIPFLFSTAIVTSTAFLPPMSFLPYIYRHIPASFTCLSIRRFFYTPLLLYVLISLFQYTVLLLSRFFLLLFLGSFHFLVHSLPLCILFSLSSYAFIALVFFYSFFCSRYSLLDFFHRILFSISKKNLHLSYSAKPVHMHC